MSKMIFELSYAGGSADFYNELNELLIDDEIEPIALDYAGHGKRRKESFNDSIPQIAEELTNYILKNITDNDVFYLMGYSMGTIVVVEILKRLLSTGEKLPQSVVLAAHEPRAKAELTDWNINITNDFVKKKVLEFGGIPKKLESNATFWRMYLPIYKHDFEMIGKYDFNAIQFRTTIPALILYSEKDTPFENIKEWCQHFIGKVNFHEYKGNHFFIYDHIDDISQLIMKWVKGEEYEL